MNHPLPEAFLNDMQKLLGNEYPAFLRAMDAPAALALRLSGAITISPASRVISLPGVK